MLNKTNNLFQVNATANIHAKDEHRKRPLHCLAYVAHKTVVRCLVEAGADIRAADNSGVPCYAMAAKSGNKPLLAWLRQVMATKAVRPKTDK